MRDQSMIAMALPEGSWGLASRVAEQFEAKFLEKNRVSLGLAALFCPLTQIIEQGFMRYRFGHRGNRTFSVNRVRF